MTESDKLRFGEQGSVIVTVATDAPLMPHQLKRMARRVPLGLARTGTVAHNGSGDIFLAFSTANEAAFATTAGGPRNLAWLPNATLDPLFTATVEAVEEAVIDSMLVNETMVGRDGHRSIAIPVEEVLDLMRRYGRPHSGPAGEWPPEGPPVDNPGSHRSRDPVA